MELTAEQLFADCVSRPLVSRGCPVLQPAALYGLTGEFVNTILPHTEADAAALLMNFLVAYGSMIGHGPAFPVEGVLHNANLYFVQVGKTSKGRKGTAYH